MAQGSSTSAWFPIWDKETPKNTQKNSTPEMSTGVKA